MRQGSSFEVVIIGGGNAGVSAAAHLIRRGVHNIAIVEPQSVHTYRPLLSYVGAGQATKRAAERMQRSVTPRGCTWVQDAAAAIEPEDRTVTCVSGTTLHYEHLILATGLEVDDEELPGAVAAMEADSVASNYLNRAEKTWQLVESMPAYGHAVFTVPRAPVSCTGTTLKPLLLAAAHWRRIGRPVRITLVIDRAGLLGVAGLDLRLGSRLQQLGVETMLSSTVTGLDPDAGEIEIDDADRNRRRIGYDMLHLVPPFRGPRWLAGAGMTDSSAHGLIDTDPMTLRHRVHDNVWAAGDAATVETDPSGGALRRQIAVLAENLLAVRRGEPMTSVYDGYTVAPIATDTHRLIAAEFDRTGAPASSQPSFLDPFVPRRIAWAFDRYVLPQMYWRAILKGRL
ncbi:MAG: FAD/NAD(P)-binding oxidoreductase [Mycolicibacterium neoaurum]|uniref:NAD(P)/FAD-dependent oxidoreductase n=1 Tax=Mycolicibacterium neoaurum TaxID=1795 RepID=UPI002FF9FD23